MQPTKLDQANMSARGFISAAIRILKSEGIPIGKYPRTSCWAKVGENREGAKLSRVGFSSDVAVHWHHPHWASDYNGEVRALCRQREAEVIAILAKHGAKFNNTRFITCRWP